MRSARNILSKPSYLGWPVDNKLLTTDRQTVGSIREVRLAIVSKRKGEAQPFHLPARLEIELTGDLMQGVSMLKYAIC